MPTFVAAASGGGELITVTVSHTIASGSDRLLLAGGTCRGDFTISSITYDAVGLSVVQDVAGAGSTSADLKGSLRRMIAPPVGTADLVMTLNSAGRATLGAANFAGVDQTTPLGTVNLVEWTRDTATTALASTCSSTTSDLVFSQFGHNINFGTQDPTFSSDGTDRWTQAFSGTQRRHFGGGSTIAGAAGTTTVTWTRGGTFSNGSDMFHLTVAIKPVSAGLLPRLSLMGTG